MTKGWEKLNEWKPCWMVIGWEFLIEWKMEKSRNCIYWAKKCNESIGQKQMDASNSKVSLTPNPYHNYNPYVRR
jgi:hypothetical protein